jgi:hypothetical protein
MNDIHIRYVGGMYPWAGSYKNKIARGYTAEAVLEMLKRK